MATNDIQAPSALARKNELRKTVSGMSEVTFLSDSSEGNNQSPTRRRMSLMGPNGLDKLAEENPASPPSMRDVQDPDVANIRPSVPRRSIIVQNPQELAFATSGSMLRRGAQRSMINISRRIVEHNGIIIFTTLLTIYALIGDDIRLICTSKPADLMFNYMVILCIVVFTAECILSCIGKDDYFLSFFFWLDVVSTGSLFLDLSWISEGIQGGGDEEGDMSNLRGGRTARLGARASRVVRVIRLVRILKLYKAYYEAKQRQKEREKNGPSDEDDWEDFETDPLQAEELNRESRVGKKLGEITIRRVIILVLTMLLTFPFLQSVALTADQFAESSFYAADNVYQTFTDYVDDRTPQAREAYENAYLKFFFYHNWYATKKDYCPDGPSGKNCANQYYAHAFWIGVAGKSEAVVKFHADLARVNMTAVKRWIAEQSMTTDTIYGYGSMPEEGLKMLAAPWSITACSTKSWVRMATSLLKDETDDISYAAPCPDDLRIPEKKRVYARLMSDIQYNEWHLDFYFDLRSYSRQDAAMNLSITGFICFVLCVAAMFFAADANHLVLNPVESMIKKVEEIRENPLIAMKMADEEFKAEEIKKAKAKRQGKARYQKLVADIVECKVCRRPANEPMETVILEKTIIKLGSLLALGFGEAGANIIGANMRGADSAGVNAMIPGHRVNCILGNVKIRNFSIATEVLRSKIMTFVNQIAEIVHGVVDEYYGAANKNNGDEFLVVWRLEDLTEEETQRLTEMAVVAFALILGGLHRSPVLAEYRSHPGLQQRLGADCRVNLSFGLHCGWAIEGAVGSEFKIDASYLSPNVSIVKSIEQVTILYGVPFIIAESVFRLLSDAMAEKIRLIDKVIITGSPNPMTIYSVDLDVQALKVDRSDPLPFPWTSQRRFRARQFLESEKLQKWNRQIQIGSYFEKDRNISTMRRRYTEEFFQHFNMGYQNYCQGEWAVARRMLAGTQNMLEPPGDEDGPSNAILRFMESYQFERPKEWQGVRVLGHMHSEVAA